MEIKEQKMEIAKNFYNKFQEWLKDLHSEMTDKEFGKKWDAVPMDRESIKDNLEGLKRFQRCHNGFWSPQWEKQGVDSHTLYMLWKVEKFLSLDEYSNWNARATGHTHFYYISQDTAKKIYKYFKEKEKQNGTGTSV